MRCKTKGSTMKGSKICRCVTNRIHSSQKMKLTMRYRWIMTRQTCLNTWLSFHQAMTRARGRKNSNYKTMEVLKVMRATMQCQILIVFSVVDLTDQVQVKINEKKQSKVRFTTSEVQGSHNKTKVRTWAILQDCCDIEKVSTLLWRSGIRSSVKACTQRSNKSIVLRVALLALREPLNKLTSKWPRTKPPPTISKQLPMSSTRTKKQTIRTLSRTNKSFKSTMTRTITATILTRTSSRWRRHSRRQSSNSIRYQQIHMLMQKKPNNQRTTRNSSKKSMSWGKK